MTHAVTRIEGQPAAWPVDTPDRILRALAGSDRATAYEVSANSGVALPIVAEWLTDKVRQGLLRFDQGRGTYCALCRWPAVATAIPVR